MRLLQHAILNLLSGNLKPQIRTRHLPPKHAAFQTCHLETNRSRPTECAQTDRQPLTRAACPGSDQNHKRIKMLERPPGLDVTEAISARAVLCPLVSGL